MIEGDIQTVGVVGAGTMGSGIAQLCAQNGLEVRLYDVSEGVLSRAEDRILRGLERAEKPEAFSLIRKTTRLDVFSGCDVVIEAASEDLELKKSIFLRLDAILAPPRVLATNTSSLSVERIACATENPDRIVGMHFFNPVAVMRLVEIVRTPKSSEAAVRTVVGLAARLGKKVVHCKDTPGFIANRVTRPFYLEGMRLIEGGIGKPAAIDAALRGCGGLRMGPFELMDLIGLDVNLAISTAIYEALGRPARLKPCRIQQELVRRGNLGRKNGQGFYLYGENLPGTANPVLDDILKIIERPLPEREVVQAVIGGVIFEARQAVEEGVATPEDIDATMRLGMNWPKGPFALAKEGF